MGTGVKVIILAGCVVVVGAGFYVILAKEYGWDLFGVGRSAKEFREWLKNHKDAVKKSWGI